MTTPIKMTSKQVKQLRRNLDGAPSPVPTKDRKNALYHLYRRATENTLDALGVDAVTRQKLFLQNKLWDTRRRTDINLVDAMLEPKKGKSK